MPRALLALALVAVCGRRVACQVPGALCGEGADAATCAGRASAPGTPEVLVLTSVLPDGLGDVVFGECAALELLAEGSARVTWVRSYPSEDARSRGEALVAAGLQALGPSSATLAYASPEALASELELGRLDHLWEAASAVFLTPWIFGIYAHDRALLALARRSGKGFWAAGEYGRGMGPLAHYTGGLGHRLPTGWEAEVSGAGALHGGIFKTILRAPSTATDWRQRFAEKIWPADRSRGAEGRPKLRLWWAYGRKDSAHVHAFRLDKEFSTGSVGGRLADTSWPEAVKVVPIGVDGTLATGQAKTTGDLLGEAALGLVDGSPASVADGVAPSELSSHVAGQLSELLVHILTRDRSEEPTPAAEVVVAPNADCESWAGSRIVRITALELLDPFGGSTRLAPNRPVFLAAEGIPRAEMRTFLEQCEREVVATGDQSVAEAVLLGRAPVARPDAKVRQWELATGALAKARVQEVPDLGASLRRLVSDASFRERVAAWSRARSAEVEAGAVARFGPAARRSATEETLLRAGMFG